MEKLIPQWPIPLFNYTPPTDDNKWCPGGYRQYVPGGGHLKACPRGSEGIIEACPGGRGTTYKLVQGGGAK